MKKSLLLLLLCSAMVLAQEPSYVCRQFGYSPPQWQGGLSEARQAELDECVKAATDTGAQSKANAEKMSSIYGMDMGRTDWFCVALTGCLAEEKQGKGWIVQEKEGENWKVVRSRYATRALMGLDPEK